MPPVARSKKRDDFPATVARSDPQIPTASTRTCTSPGPGSRGSASVRRNCRTAINSATLVISSKIIREPDVGRRPGRRPCAAVGPQADFHALSPNFAWQGTGRGPAAIRRSCEAPEDFRPDGQRVEQRMGVAVPRVDPGACFRAVLIFQPAVGVGDADSVQNLADVVDACGRRRGDFIAGEQGGGEKQLACQVVHSNAAWAHIQILLCLELRLPALADSPRAGSIRIRRLKVDEAILHSQPQAGE